MIDYAQIEAELKEFEAQERRRLGLEEETPAHWHDRNPQAFTPPGTVADEPTSALDALTRSEILQLLAALNRQLGTAILFISHDFLSVAALCRRVAVLHDGGIVESGTTGELLGRPRHPYTQALVGAVQGPDVRPVPYPAIRLGRGFVDSDIVVTSATAVG